MTTPIHAANDYQAQVIRVLDGDTFEAMVEVWPQNFIKTKIRLQGIDTPEKRSSRYRKVPACEKVLAKAATDRMIVLIDQKSVVLNNVKLGKYAGRVLASATVDGVSLKTTMINEGHARPYNGGTRNGWCI